MQEQKWWRVTWNRQGAGGPLRSRNKPSLSRRFGSTGGIMGGMLPGRYDANATWRHKCWFPVRFYPTSSHLPRKRREIDVFEDLRR